MIVLRKSDYGNAVLELTFFEGRLFWLCKGCLLHVLRRKPYCGRFGYVVSFLTHAKSPRSPPYAPAVLNWKTAEKYRVRNTVLQWSSQTCEKRHKYTKYKSFLQHTRFASLAFFARLWKVNHVIFCSKHFTRSMSYLCYKNWIPISRLRRLFPKNPLALWNWWFYRYSGLSAICGVA